VWALTSAGNTNVTKEIEALMKLADESINDANVDTYLLSLFSASLYNLNRTEEAERFANEVTRFQREEGNVTNSKTSITSSEGFNLQLETTAIATIAWLNN